MSEREWREASDMRVPAAALLGVLVVGAALRFWALGQGLPYLVGSDEPVMAGIALQMMRTGDFNPHFFDYPGLLIYLHLAIGCARFLWGAIQGTWHALGDMTQADLILWGRAATAAFGLATVLLVYHIGGRWGSRHGLLAAGLMAVLPMHVRESHYMLTDVPLTFFTALTLLLTLQAHERPAIGRFALAGVAAGLASASKYNGVLVLVVPLVAAWMTLEARPSRLACALAALGASVATFFVTAPYTLLDLPAFLEAFGRLTLSYRPRPDRVEPEWITYVKHLRLSLGWPAFLVMFAGIGLALVRAVRGPGRLRWTLLLVFPALYFRFIAGQSLVYGRYLLPLTPFVCVLVGTTVVSGVSLLRRFDIPRAARSALIISLTVAVLLPPVIEAARFNVSIALPSTQEAAYRWIIERLPMDSAIAIEGSALRLPPSFRVEWVRSLTERDSAGYVEAGFTHIVAASNAFGPVFRHPQRFPKRYAAYRTLFEQNTELFRVGPSPERTGPEIRVYRLTP